MKYLPKNRRAFALVLVLISVVLATTMAVFFLSSVGRERMGVALYATGGEVHHLSGLPVSEVMGRINTATKRGTAADPVSWASQPGMIRTYLSTGSPDNVYKLYSWDNQVEAGAGFSPTNSAQIPPNDWRTKTALFTDINQPINGVYPIIDPTAEGTVAGFSVDEGNAVVGGANKENAPMPVKWLYVLKDGQRVAPTGTDTTATVSGASATNPIIGRIAYWTDDETCKVNINTASEGSFWDVPRSGTPDDVQFAGNPLTKNEFQRTPGHPAMTSLSAVFPELVTEDTANPTRTRWLGSYASEMKNIYDMSPRLAWGCPPTPTSPPPKSGDPANQGSQGGAYPVPSYSYTYPPARDSIPISSLPRPVILDADRLYTVADDFWFQPDRNPNTALNSKLTTTEYQKRLLFLTANSRAPETTIFDTPRVSLWPITWPNASSYFPTRTAKNATLKAPTTFNDPITDTSTLPAKSWITAEERLLAFCAMLNTQNTGGGDRYFFQRKDPDSPVNDWDDASGTTTHDKRNRDLVDYLTRLMAKPAPGFGSSLQTSLGGAEQANWAALNTLNFSRAQVNQYTMPSAIEGVRYSFTGVSFRFGNIGGIPITGASYTEPNAKVATPLRATINSKEYHTVGSYPVLEEAALVFYAAKRQEPIPPAAPPSGTAVSNALYPDWRDPLLWGNLINFDPLNGYANSNGTSGPTGARTTVMRAVMLLDFTGLQPGVNINPTFWVKVKGNSFSATTGAASGAIGFPSTTGKVVKCTLNSATTYNTVMNPLMDNTDAPKVFSNTATGANVWQLVSDDIPVNPSDTTFGFTGSMVNIEVYSCDPSNPDTDPTTGPNAASRKIYEKKMDFTKWNGNASAYPVPIAPRWSTTSRSYRFDPNGNAYGNVTTGSLPGTLLPKTFAGTGMSKFYHDSNSGSGSTFSSPVALPLHYDLWQPNPNYKNTAAGTVGTPGTSVAGVPAARSPTTWAWAEYAPGLDDLSQSGGTLATLSDPRSVTTVYQARAKKTPYLYRGGIAGYSKDDVNDLDDKLEKNSGDSDVLRNISTNFRKRVAATSQRNTANRPAICLEGWEKLVAPTDYTDPNIMWVISATQSQTADYFMHSTEMPLREFSALLTPYDTIFSMVNTPPNANDDRDPRLVANSGVGDFSTDNFDSIKTVMGSTKSPAEVIGPTFPRGASSGATLKQAQWHQFGTPGAVPAATGYRSLPLFNSQPFARSADTARTGTPSKDYDALVGIVAGIWNTMPFLGDWTGMPGRYQDGGLLLRPDQDYQQLAQDTSGDMYVPYYDRQGYGNYLGGTNAGATAPGDSLSYFSPNRQIPSPVILGTLPRTMSSNWQTLVFCPQPANKSHPGLRYPDGLAENKAPDHLILDLFWMPVAEPYPISDQLSTAGKVNLNYPMMPFPYITRKTALYAAMKNVWMTAIAETTDNRAFLKSIAILRSIVGNSTRYAIDVAETLKAFDTRVFSVGDLFRSASELCDMNLVPLGQTDAKMSDRGASGFWSANQLTPDNAREQPYNDLYSRVTTKSNTYTVHWRVQSLRKAPNSNPAIWDESRDNLMAELRGSTLIERYIDPNTKDDPATTTVNEGIPDYATDVNAEPLGKYYKWRVVSENYFQP